MLEGLSDPGNKSVALTSMWDKLRTRQTSFFQLFFELPPVCV